MNEEAENEVWHALCNAERIIRFLDSVVRSGERLTLDQEQLTKKNLIEIEVVKSHFLVEE